jgi:hypothetical protein
MCESYITFTYMVKSKSNGKDFLAHSSLFPTVLLHECNNKCAQLVFIFFVRFLQGDMVLWVLPECACEQNKLIP